MNHLINSIEDARKTAINWSTANKKDIIQSIQYSEYWFEKTPSEYRKSESLKIQLEIFTLRKIQECSDWKKASDEAWQRNSEWTLETVKHLSIINGAGLAGCSAMLANSSNTLSLHLPFILFSIGLLLALADLYFCSLGYENTGEKYNNLYFNIKMRNTTQILLNQSIKQILKKINSSILEVF